MAWKKGPLPPSTWGWGGVVPKGTQSGFFFADFCGDHVRLVGPTEDVKPQDVLWYDNSLELPPAETGVKGRAKQDVSDDKT